LSHLPPPTGAQHPDHGPELQQELDAARQLAQDAHDLPSVERALSALANLPAPELRHPILDSLLSRAQDIGAQSTETVGRQLAYALFDAIESQAAITHQQPFLARFLESNEPDRPSLAARMEVPEMRLQVVRAAAAEVRNSPPGEVVSKLYKLTAEVENLVQSPAHSSHMGDMAQAVHAAIEDGAPADAKAGLHAHMLSSGSGRRRLRSLVSLLPEARQRAEVLIGSASLMASLPPPQGFVQASRRLAVLQAMQPLFGDIPSGQQGAHFARMASALSTVLQRREVFPADDTRLSTLLLDMAGEMKHVPRPARQAHFDQLDSLVNRLPLLVGEEQEDFEKEYQRVRDWMLKTDYGPSPGQGLPRGDAPVSAQQPAAQFTSQELAQDLSRRLSQTDGVDTRVLKDDLDKLLLSGISGSMTGSAFTAKHAHLFLNKDGSPLATDFSDLSVQVGDRPLSMFLAQFRRELVRLHAQP
jgi:hypothetical protein